MISKAAAADPECCCQSPDKRQETEPHHTSPQITALASCESKEGFQNLTAGLQNTCKTY